MTALIIIAVLGVSLAALACCRADDDPDGIDDDPHVVALFRGEQSQHSGRM